MVVWTVDGVWFGCCGDFLIEQGSSPYAGGLPRVNLVFCECERIRVSARDIDIKIRVGFGLWLRCAFKTDLFWHVEACLPEPFEGHIVLALVVRLHACPQFLFVAEAREDLLPRGQSFL